MTFKVLESDESQIYLNLTTLEGKKVTVKLCARGFCVVSKEAHDTDSTGISFIQSRLIIFILVVIWVVLQSKLQVTSNQILWGSDRPKIIDL